MTTADQGAPAAPSIDARQPVIGLLGALIIAVVLWLLFILPGMERSLFVLGPISTFWLPVLAVSALWWGGWPGNKLEGGRSAAGAGNTLLFAGSAVVLTYIGMLIVGPTSISGMFTSGLESTTFPWTIPLAAVVFVVMLQLTFVTGKWPLHKLPAVQSGFAALAVSWGVGLVLYWLFVDFTAFAPPEALDGIGIRNPGGFWGADDFVALLLSIVIWQIALTVLLGGWPFTSIKSDGARLAAFNGAVIGGGWVTYLILSTGFNAGQIAAIGGAATAAIFVCAMLFETWPFQGASAAVSRAGVGGLALALTFAGYFGLRGLANTLHTFQAAPVEFWVAVAALNFIAAMVILHYAVWGRWPLTPPAPPPE
ncbi:MAG: hypothetical protein ACE5GC_02705 [Acidimicrobiia bacterium]